MADNFRDFQPSLSSPIEGGAFAITPNDNSDLPQTTLQIYATGAGNIAAVFKSGNTGTFPVASGDLRDVRIKRVLATGTTATGLYGFY